MRKVKGFSLATLIIIIAAVAIVGAVIYFTGRGGLGIGGGKGDGEGSGNAEAKLAMATTVETEETTAITTQEIEYINITVDENSYLYNNKKYDVSQIDELISTIKSNEEKLTIRITDENASLKAYDLLTDTLKENDYRYIEVSENEKNS